VKIERYVIKIHQNSNQANSQNLHNLFCSNSYISTSTYITPLEISLSFLLISDVSDGEVDRDDDGFSPQPTNVHFNGSDGGYLEIPPEGMSAPPPTNKMSLPGSPQKKMIQPIIEEESNAQEGEVESNNSAER